MIAPGTAEFAGRIIFSFWLLRTAVMPVSADPQRSSSSMTPANPTASGLANSKCVARATKLLAQIAERWSSGSLRLWCNASFTCPKNRHRSALVKVRGFICAHSWEPEGTSANNLSSV